MPTKEMIDFKEKINYKTKSAHKGDNVGFLMKHLTTLLRWSTP